MHSPLFSHSTALYCYKPVGSIKPRHIRPRLGDYGECVSLQGEWFESQCRGWLTWQCCSADKFKTAVQAVLDQAVQGKKQLTLSSLLWWRRVNWHRNKNTLVLLILWMYPFLEWIRLVKWMCGTRWAAQLIRAHFFGFVIERIALIWML